MVQRNEAIHRTASLGIQFSKINTNFLCNREWTSLVDKGGHSCPFLEKHLTFSFPLQKCFCRMEWELFCDEHHNTIGKCWRVNDVQDRKRKKFCHSSGSSEIMVQCHTFNFVFSRLFLLNFKVVFDSSFKTQGQLFCLFAWFDYTSCIWRLLCQHFHTSPWMIFHDK